MWLNSANKIFFFLNKFIVVYLIIIMVDSGCPEKSKNIVYCKKVILNELAWKS